MSANRKEHISKGERRRRNQAEKRSQLEEFRTKLLWRRDEQIVSTIGSWMNGLKGEISERGDYFEALLDDFCELLGFRVVPDVTDGQPYASYSAWIDSVSDEEEECAGVEIEFGDVPSSIRRRIKDLSIKDLDKLTDVAYWHIYAEARDDGKEDPPQHPEFIKYLMGTLPCLQRGRCRADWYKSRVLLQRNIYTDEARREARL